MGKRKWKRVSLQDLASPEEQERLLGVMDLAKGQPQLESAEKRPPESPQDGR